MRDTEKTFVRRFVAADTLVLPAPAKVNLFLHITKRRDDGMHELQTVFQLLDYGDEIRFRIRDDGAVNVRCDEDIAPQENNVFRAASLLREKTAVHLGADIEIHKRIPLGAGLGGGSSDAATTLHGLNCLWGAGCGNTDLMRLARTLGADVPVFVNGCSAWAEGIGERLMPMELPPRYFAVFTPPLSVSTREMFAVPELQRDCVRMTPDGYRIGDGKNVFEPLTTARYPEIADGMEWLAGFATPRLSGTGSAFFACFDNKSQARDILDKAPDNLHGFVALGLKESLLHTEMAKLPVTAG